MIEGARTTSVKREQAIVKDLPKPFVFRPRAVKKHAVDRLQDSISRIVEGAKK